MRRKNEYIGLMTRQHLLLNKCTMLIGAIPGILRRTEITEGNVMMREISGKIVCGNAVSIDERENAYGW